MHIEVCDDGQGFEINNETVGNGIGNMQARAKELGSELVIRSAPEKGTQITLQFEFHPIEVQTALHS
jgi:signal transduction histidine kinase